MTGRWIIAGLCLAVATASMAGEPAKPETTAICGKVYAVDEPLGLVMIDVGSDRGVVALQVFSLLRNGGLVGYVKIATVLPTASGALIDKKRTFRRIKVGDEAIAEVARPRE